MERNSNALAFNPHLHGLRGLAAIAVFLFHWGSTVGFFPNMRQKLRFELFGTSWDAGLLLDFGWLGVPLFFILSGFLLTTQIANKCLTWSTIAHFWLRRCLRIYPAFWLQLGILITLGSSTTYLAQISDFGELTRHIFLWLNLPPWMTKPLNGVWWTLPIELGFYLLLPILVALSRHIGWKAVVVGALLISVSWRYGVMYIYQSDNYVQHLPVLDSIPGSLFTFCVGFALAHILADQRPRSAKHRYIVLGVGVFTFYLLLVFQRANNDVYWTGHWILGVWNLLIAVTIGGLMYALIQPPSGFNWLASGPMIWLGDISFGIYLWHFPILMILAKNTEGHWDTPGLELAALVVSMIATLIAASISFYCLERPVIKRRW